MVECEGGCVLVLSIRLESSVKFFSCLWIIFWFEANNHYPYGSEVKHGGHETYTNHRTGH